MKKNFDSFLFTLFFITYILLVIIAFYKNNNNYDVNNDGKVNAQDYTEIKNYIMNKEN